MVTHAVGGRPAKRVGMTALLLLLLMPQGSARAAAAATGAPVVPQTRPIAPGAEDAPRPIDQELCAADWWIARAMSEAERIGDAKERARATWRIGVAAFDAGRLDLARRVMEMPLLDAEDQGTIAGRLCSAFEATGDLRRLEELAPLIRYEPARDNAYEGVVKLYAARNEFAKAEHAVESMGSHFRRNGAYLWLAQVRAKAGDLPAVWALAEKAARGENSSDAPKGFLLYIEAADKAGKPEEVDRAVRKALEIGANWPDDMRQDLAFDLIDTLRACRQGARADALAGKVGGQRARRPEREATDRYFEAVELAEAGQYAKAAQKAEEIGDRHWFAAALAHIARSAAEQKPRSQDAAALRQMIERAKSALADVPREKPEGEPGRDAFSTVRDLAIALAASGKPDEALKAVGTSDDGSGPDPDRLLDVARERADAGDVEFVRAAVASHGGAAGKPESGMLAFALAVAQVKAGQVDQARKTAERIDDPAYRCYALLTVARAYCRAGDVPACNQVLDRARAAADQAGDLPRPAPYEVIAQIQAETMQPRLVWASIGREADPVRRVRLMLAAADGLLGRLHDPPWTGIPHTPDH